MVETVVVGGGIAGCAVALALRERDVPLTLVDAARPGAGATGASAGMLAPQYEASENEAFFRFAVESRARWPEFARRLARASGSEVEMLRSGALVANFDGEEQEGALAAARRQRDAGLRAELLPPAEAAQRQPGLTPVARSWLWLPDEEEVDAQALSVLLRDAMLGAGVRLITGNAVQAICSGGGRVTGVVLEDGRGLEADIVILAAGAWSAAIDGLPRRLPLRPVRGQLLRYETAAGVVRAMVADHYGHYLVPRGHGRVLAGSTMEEAGFDRSITDEGRRLIEGHVARLLPAFRDQHPLEHWADLRPISEDGLPILGPDPDLGGLFYAAGYGRNGILIAPLAGEVVADLVLTGESAIAWQGFRPDRAEHSVP